MIAAAQTDVPLSVLKAITLTETGRPSGGEMRSWPWTVNMEGTGVWFDTAEAAQAYADEHFKRGARSFDVGCFQINYKWHHEAFASLRDMFEPVANALYAADFLTRLFAELGDWESAAGAYHSRTPEHAERYTQRFAEFRAQYLHEDNLPLPARRGQSLGLVAADPSVGAGPRARINSFPLLQSGGTGALGSLVPPGARAGASLFPPDAES